MNTPNENDAAKCSTALLNGEIEPGDVPVELIPQLLDTFTKHEKTMKAFKTYAKGQIMEGVKVDGWFIKPGNQVRNFTKLVDLYKHLKAEYGCTQAQFHEIASVKTDGVKKIIKAGLLPGTPTAKIEFLVTQLVEEYGEIKQNAGSLAAQK